MSAIERKNAVITSTSLGAEDHGIFTVSLCLEYESGVQCFGGYAMDSYDKIKKRRVGTAYGLEFIKRVMDTVGVTEWSQLAGKHIRAEAEHIKVHAIGHIVKDKWFNPERDLKEFVVE